MSEPRNNSFTKDSINVRLYRLMRLQNNIALYSAELGLSQSLVTWANSCYTNFSQAVTDARVADGEAKDSTILLHDKFAVATVHYQKAKELIIALLKQSNDSKFLYASYGVNKTTPISYNGLVEAVETFAETNARLVAAGDPRVISQVVVQNMVAAKNNLLAEMEKAGIKQRKSTVAYQTQHSLEQKDTPNLRFILKTAVLIWGNNDPRLRDIGFVPKSQIWTPMDGGLPEPANFAYVPASVSFTWDTVQKATAYRIEHREGETGEFSIITETPNTKWVLNLPYFGEHFFRVRALEGEESGFPTVPIKLGLGALGSITGFYWDEITEVLHWNEVAGATGYLLLDGDRDFGEVFTSTAMPVHPITEGPQLMRVWGTNGLQATNLSDVVVIPQKP